MAVTEEEFLELERRIVVLENTDLNKIKSQVDGVRNLANSAEYRMNQTLLQLKADLKKVEELIGGADVVTQSQLANHEMNIDHRIEGIADILRDLRNEVATRRLPDCSNITNEVIKVRDCLFDTSGMVSTIDLVQMTNIALEVVLQSVHSSPYREDE